MPFLTKLFGVGFIVFGLAVILFCSTAIGHQPIAITNGVMVFGFVMMAIGFLLFFI